MKTTKNQSDPTKTTKNLAPPSDSSQRGLLNSPQLPWKSIFWTLQLSKELACWSVQKYCFPNELWSIFSLDVFHVICPYQHGLYISAMHMCECAPWSVTDVDGACALTLIIPLCKNYYHAQKVEKVTPGIAMGPEYKSTQIPRCVCFSYVCACSTCQAAHSHKVKQPSHRLPCPCSLHTLLHTMQFQ